ncbi:MAG TPA: ABC transporter permease [Acidimicrobiales bacterium]|nr:ABC transporter permease [Acidimicrobiales bacterium]
MIQYVIAGLVLGGIYAIASAGLVLTYVSSGILNFAFGSLAYFIARLYYYLHVQHHWGIAAAAAFSILVAAPLLGVFLYAVLFRFLRLSASVIKVVATIGLAVTIPPIATLLFGNQSILRAPGLAPEPVKVYHLASTPITLDQLIVYGCVIATVVVGALVLRYSDVGLTVRAMVDSEAMTALSGTNPSAVSVGVWALSTFFAGLAGVLAAPIIGLDPGDYTLLVAAAFAAVIAAKLRSLPIAVIVGLLMGVAGGLVQRYMPASSSLTAAVIPSIPFAFIVVFLLFHMRSGRVSESEGVGGALDRAIIPHVDDRLAGVESPTGAPRGLLDRYLGVVFMLALVAIFPLILHGFWVGLVGEAIAFAVVFLSFTLVTGEGGMIWLCQITFAGVGAIAAAQLASRHGWPALLAILAGGVIAAPMGVIIGFLTIRLGDLYVALVTLTFGLLMERLVFSRNVFYKFGLGVNLARPHFARTDRAFSYMMLIVFGIVALLIVNLKRSTAGLALNAVRWSEPASRTIGLSVVQMKVLVAGLAAFVAGVGGGFLATYAKVALPDSYATLAGLVWLAVLVTAGVQSNMAALFAGFTFTFFPALVLTYLSKTWGQVPPALFGLGAIFVSRNPEGALAVQGRQIRWLIAKARRRSGPSAAVPSADQEVEAVPAPAAVAVANGAVDAHRDEVTTDATGMWDR